MDEDRGLSEDMAKIAEYNNGQALRKVLREGREFGKFYGLIKIVQAMFPEDEIQLMSEYALTVDPKKQTARFLLEYCEINKINNVKVELLKKMKNCSNNTSKEWASIYQNDLDYVNGDISFVDAISNYDKISANSLEGKIARLIYKSYCYMDEQMHELISQLTINLESEIMKIKEEYIKEAFFARLKIFQMAHKVRKNQLSEAREICLKVLNETENSNFRAWSCIHLGNSYILDSYDDSIFYLNKGLEIANKHDVSAIENLKRSINFVSTLWNKDSIHFNLESNHPADVHEIAFYYIRFKQFKKATQTLDSLDFENITENQKAFHMYFRGLISGNMSDFTKSIVHFKNSHDHYFKRLPILELKKMGVEQCILDALLV